MAKIIDDNTSVDNTIRLYDAFYSTSLIVGTDQYDIVHGYFEQICASKTIAANFTVFLFRIAQETNVNVLDLLDQLKGLNDKMKINQVIAYYMNSLKSKTSLYGVSTIPKPNVPVARNIVQ